MIGKHSARSARNSPAAARSVSRARSASVDSIWRRLELSSQLRAARLAPASRSLFAADVGADEGTNVSATYKQADNRCTGKIEKAVIEVGSSNAGAAETAGVTRSGRGRRRNGGIVAPRNFRHRETSGFAPRVTNADRLLQGSCADPLRQRCALHLSASSPVTPAHERDQ